MMRIGFIGKGGTGKTSISSAFAKYIARNNKVLFIDADVNAHAHECFQMSPSKPFGDQSLEVSKYFHGSREDILPSQMIGSTLPNKDSNLIKNIDTDKFLKSMTNNKDNISLLTVGTYTEEDSGVNCYHTKLEPLEILLHHTFDKEDEYIIMDATAGVDILGTSLYMAFDVLFFIIEPTKKSISVYKNFINQTDVKVIPILNKVTNDRDVEFVKNQNIDPLVCINFSETLRSFEQGNNQEFEEFIKNNYQSFDKLKNSLSSKQDKSDYFKTLSSIYKKSCESWYNNYFGTNIYEKTNKNLDFINNVGGNNA